MKITNLSKSFDGKAIFKDYSSEFATGKITYLMGESGVGKTTLLRMISGLDTDYTGEITYEGKLAYVFQEPRLFPNLSVLSNLKIVNDNPTLNAKKLLKSVELNDCEDMLPSELSGGMKMRLSIARAVYYDPDIILMDEPFASLDKEMKDRIVNKIFKLLSGKTIIIISHDRSDAEKYADHIIEIKKTD